MLTFGHKYSYPILLIVGFVLGFYMSCLFSGCGGADANLPAVTTIKPEQNQKQVAAVQATYQGRIDSLGAAAKTLQATLQNTRVALEKAKQKNAALQTQVYHLLDRTTAPSPDSVTQLADCDTLGSKVKDLLATDSLKDSLYEKTTADLQAEVANKDSTLQTRQEQYDTLRRAFDQSIQQQQSLVTSNTILQKQLRHHKRAGVFRTIGLAIAAVLATHYLSR